MAAEGGGRACSLSVSRVRRRWPSLSSASAQLKTFWLPRTIFHFQLCRGKSGRREGRGKLLLLLLQGGGWWCGVVYVCVCVCIELYAWLMLR